MNANFTFSQCENEMGITMADNQFDSALGTWYSSVRDKKLSDFDDGDLSIACRQELYLDHVVPAAVERLRSDPLAGKKYEGELLVALQSVPTDFWASHACLAETVRAIVEPASNQADAELRSDILNLINRLSISATQEGKQA
jgi:hypothetical protein